MTLVLQDAVELPRGLFPRDAATWPWWLGAAAMAVVLVVWLRRSRLRPRDTPEPCPGAVALAGLTRLRESAPRGRADSVETSALLRDYIAARFDLPAQRMTTDEVAAEIEGVADIVAFHDRVKFAGHTPLAEERRNDIDAIESFVRSTSDSP